MRATLGINNCFAVKRWPRPDDWAAIVSNDLGLDTVELSLDLLAGPTAFDLLTGPAARDRLAEQTRAALARHGLRAGTVFTGLAAYSLNLFMHPDAEYRAAARRWYRQAIDLTAQLGATAVGGHVGALTVPDGADPATRAQRWAGLREHLADLAAYAQERGLDHLLVENLVTDREPSTISSIENILAERSVAHAPVQLCVDLGHPFVCGGSPADRDPYAWLAHFGPRIAEVQLQQSDGLADHHWPFTPERNATGLVDPARVLDTLAGAGVTDILLILEVIPPFEQDDRQVIGDLRASAEVWRQALAERGLR
jgi:sugar phosphate isomerase/epimerase